MVANAYTLLEITGEGIQPYSARGLSQTLDPIAQATQTRRTINGALKDLSFDGFRKYKSTISANDQTAPALAENWPGRIITVQCTAELSYKTAGGAPGRAVVSGSSRVDGAYTFYRPELQMMVTLWTMSRDEYGSQVSWSLQLEEV